MLSQVPQVFVTKRDARVSLKPIIVSALVGALALAACDKDPAAPNDVLALLACPANDLPVNASIPLNFSEPVRASTVTGGNVIVTNATSGLEIPGVLSLTQNGTQVLFSPSAPLPFGTVLGVRVQNLLSAAGGTPLGVVVCNLRTEAAPITEVVWQHLDSPTGSDLYGASLFAPDSGWAASIDVPLYRRLGQGWEVRFNQPYYIRSYDVGFASINHGFGAHLDQRLSRSVITESRDGGLSFDTVFTRANFDVQRLWIDSIGSNNRLFGVAGGGRTTLASFYKLNPATSRFAVTSEFGVTSSVSDIDFSPGDTLNGYAVSQGVHILLTPARVYPGRLYHSVDGGASWTEVAGAHADTSTVITYRGVARRKNGDVYVTGGTGFFGRFVGGAGPVQPINLGIASRDSTSPTALIYNDVEFAPDNDQVGWVVGAQLVGFVAGVPKYQGLIFGTRDGGATWTRQGVIGAPDYGAQIPALRRIAAFSSSKVWIVGDAGTVLSLNQ